MVNEGVGRGRPTVKWNGVEVPKVVHTSTALVAQYPGHGKLGAIAHNFLDMFDETTVYIPPAAGAPTYTDDVKTRLVLLKFRLEVAPRVRFRPDSNQPDQASPGDLQARVCRRRDEADSHEAVPRSGIQGAALETRRDAGEAAEGQAGHSCSRGGQARKRGRH